MSSEYGKLAPRDDGSNRCFAFRYRLEGITRKEINFLVLFTGWRKRG